LFDLWQPQAAALTALTVIEPSAASRPRACVCIPLSLPDHRTGKLLQAPVSTVTSDGVITREVNTAHGQLSAGLPVSIFMDSTLTQRLAAFKVRCETAPANVILSLSLAHAARCLVSEAHVRKTTSAQLQPRIAVVADWQPQ